VTVALQQILLSFPGVHILLLFKQVCNFLAFPFFVIGELPVVDKVLVVVLILTKQVDHI